MNASSDTGSGFSRRHFLRLGGAIAVVGLGSCSSPRSGRPTNTSTSTAGTSTSTAGTSTSAVATSATAGPATTNPATATPGGSLGGRRLVIVQLNGGNDGLNTVVPLAGAYHDARPTLGIADDRLVALDGVTDIGLHPALQPLVPLWRTGRLAIVRGIGFPDPDRSHFVSMDRWWRADDVHAPGWLGRVLDERTTEPEALYAAAFGGATPILAGATRQGASVGNPTGFTFATSDPTSVRALGAPVAADPLFAAAQHAIVRAVDAVVDFDRAMDSGPDDADDDREGGATIAGGLAVAARLLAADVGTQIVVVSAGGFDTHSGQAETQQRLLADVAAGITTFFEAAATAGLDVMLATTSEFGRRVHENGSGGTDHGAGNVSFVVGPGVHGAVVGEIDLADLLDGDVRPTVDPRTLFTACLDWIGADAAAVLGRRYDEVPLLA